jgi:spermidine synthase
MSRHGYARGEQTEVFRVTSHYNDIVVTERGFIRTLSFGGHRQSSMYLDAPFDTDFEYPSYFHLTLAVVPGARRALAIGLGGGTVVKRMWRDYPAMRIDAVEMDPAVVDVARRYFELPEDERIRVFVDDGRRFAETCSDTYDIIVIDAFDGDELPPPLADEGFMLALRQRLSPRGAVIYNVMGAVQGDASAPFSEIHRLLSEAWQRVWVFVVDEGVAADGLANVLLLATDAPLTTDTLRARITSRVDGRVSVPAFHLFGSDLWEVGAPE